MASKGSLTIDGTHYRPKKGEVPRPKHGDFFLVAQDMVLSYRTKFQLNINFFRVKAISTGLRAHTVSLIADRKAVNTNFSGLWV